MLHTLPSLEGIDISREGLQGPLCIHPIFKMHWKIGGNAGIQPFLSARALCQPTFFLSIHPKELCHGFLMACGIHLLAPSLRVL